MQYLLESGVWSVGGLVLGYVLGNQFAEIRARLERIERLEQTDRAERDRDHDDT